MWFWLEKLLGRRPNAPDIPETTWRQVEERLPFLEYLSATKRRELRLLALAFLDTKVFCGAQGFEPDTPVRLSIALQACLPILKLGLPSYNGWSGIIVYPGDFVVPRRVVDENGLLHEYAEDALGESWDGGPVVLSWFDDPADYDGANVVIHEFVHKLDMLNGEADGVPPLHAGMIANDWIDMIDSAFDDFCLRVEHDRDTGGIDAYAAEHPAEFFAVTSEVFFTAPARLRRMYPNLYKQFITFYRQDPATGAEPAL